MSSPYDELLFGAFQLALKYLPQKEYEEFMEELFKRAGNNTLDTRDEAEIGVACNRANDILNKLHGKRT